MNPSRTPASRFKPERLFRPRSVVVIGPKEGPTEGERRLADIVLANLASFPGAVRAIRPGEPPGEADVAVLATEDQPVTPLLATLAHAGIFAAICLGMAPDIAAGQQATGVRVLGPGSFGVACPALQLNATLSHLTPLPGRVALVSQSAALCRAVLDWAEPNGVGFSTVVGIGGNAGVGFGAVLDFLSHDSTTGPILLDIRRIRDRRAFLSAARAAARSRPVVAIRAGGRLLDPTGRADAVFNATLKRAGVLTVSRLEDMLAALETLTRAPPFRGGGLAIVTNSIGPGRMAADAALGAGVALAELTLETRAVLGLAFPGEQTGSIVYVGVADPTRLSQAVAMLTGAREVGGVLAVLAPTGPADAVGVAALAAMPRGRVPLMVCAMGETTGAGHRRTLAAAGIPAFPSPEQAVQGFHHLLRDREARASARELPPSDVLELRPDPAALAQVVASVRNGGRLALTSDETATLLAIYGIATPSTLVCLADDAMFGPAISLGARPASDRAYELPPLNLPLAHALLQRVGVADAAMADLLVRVSQLVVDCPALATLTLAPDGTTEAVLHPPGRRSMLTIPPYPAELVETWEAAGETFTIRPIRPEDAAAYRALFDRVGLEDKRMRFFSTVRDVSAERIARMTQVDYDREMAFVAERANGDTAGGSRLVRDGELGEFAILVEPATKGTGLARHLMDRMIDWGRAQGMVAIVGQVLLENRPMLAFVRRLGFTVTHSHDDPDVADVRLNLAPAHGAMTI